MKRVFVFLLSVIMVFTLIVPVFAEEVVSEPPVDVTLENGINLSLIDIYDTQGYMVWCSDDVEGDVVIPESYMDIPVRKIQTGSFSENKNITSVTMPDTVWEIADGAFCQCPNLKWIDISKNIRTIGDEAFQSMWGLEEYLIGGSKTGESNPYAYTESLTQKNGVHSYFVRDDVLFLNESLYLIGNNFRNFDYIRLFSYPQGKKDTVYKIPNDVIGVDNTAFFSPVYLKTLVIPASLRSFYAFGLYYYDYNDMDLLGGSVNVVFQHDSVPENLKTYYYNENGEKKAVYIPAYIEGGFINDAWDGSQLIFKNDAVSGAFAEENIAEENRDGDGGSELPSFVVAPKATETLTLDTVVDEIDLDDTVTIFATQSPLDTTDDLEFSTADENIAAFDGFSRGYLSGVSVGTTTYYVKSGDKMVQHDVTVTCDHIDRNGNSTLSDWTQTKAPTCTEDGTEVITCTQEGCQQVVKTRAIDKLNHTKTDGSSAYSDVITAPDCYNKGYTTHTCSLCKDVVVDTYTEALNHTHEDGSSAYEYYSEVAAKCEEDGHTIEKCSLCGNEQVGSVIPKTGHNYVGKETVAPGCTSEGVMTYSCSACGSSYTEAVSAKGHSFGDWYETLAPTCTEMGTEERKCSSCGAVETREVKSLGHNYSDIWTVDEEATCTENGSKSHHCSRCESKADITVIEKLGHDYGEWVITKEPTCTEEGSKYKDCSRCDSIITETIKANGHSFSEEFTIDKEATCIEDGQKSRHCANCDEITDTTVIKSEGHKETTVVTNPTCSDKGYTTHTCTVCKESYTDTFIDALGHKYGEWTENLAPTCTTAGQKTAYCERCDKYITEVIPVIPHNYGEWKTVKEATCTETGKLERKCISCTSVETDVIKAKGHTSVTDKAVSPTCTSTGLTEGSHCSVCDAVLVAQETVSALGHSYGNWIVTKEPTCTTDGEGYKACSRCGDKVKGSTPALGHTSSGWITDNPATCTSVGSKHKECTVCHTTLETGTIAVIAHNEKTVITAPTCTEKGYTTYTCIYCGNTRKENYVNAKGHRETNWLVDKAPTCSSTGSKHIECADCGVIIETATMDKLAHTEGEWITDKKATVYSEGKKHLECKNCKATIKTATIKQLVCSKPKLTKIENTSSGVKISWDKKSGADRYRVYRKTSKGDWKYLDTTTNLYFTDKTAKSGTKYYYAVKARNEAGNSDLSYSKSIYYIADPTLKSVSSSRGGITLKWNRVTGAQGYVIYRKTADGSYKKLTTVKGSTKTSYVDKSAKKGKKYTYKVKAYYSKTYSAYSNTKTIKDRY